MNLVNLCFPVAFGLGFGVAGFPGLGLMLAC